MKKIVLTLAGALAIVACGSASAADLDSGSFVGVVTQEGDALPWYASAKAGVALPGSINVTATGGGFPQGDLEGSASFNAGFAGSIALGKYITPNVRAELELGLARNSGRSFEGELSVTGPVEGDLTGDVTTTTLMAIGYYEFTNFGDFVPYLSAGIGGANVHSDLTFDDDGGIASGTITGNSLVFAARIGAGFQFAITDSIDLTAEYTALIGSNATFTWDAPAGGFTREVSSGVMGHALAVGLKGRF